MREPDGAGGLRLLVEIGRFIVIAVAVAIAIPSAFLVISLATNEAFSFEAFFGLGAISFVMAVVGGIFVGIPALWFARIQRWERETSKLALFGCLAGAAGAVLMSIFFWQGSWDLVTSGVPIWAGMGAFAGLVASILWYWLQLNDAGSHHHA